MSNRDNSLVHKAVMRQNLPELTKALSEGEAVDSLDRAGRTALFYTIQDGEVRLTEELLKSGANPNAQDKNLETPLHFAARKYQVNLAKRLLEAGADPNVKDNNGNSPLWRAVFECDGRGDMIKLLMKSGASKSLKNNHDVSPEDLANTIANYDLKVFLR